MDGNDLRIIPPTWVVSIDSANLHYTADRDFDSVEDAKHFGNSLIDAVIAFWTALEISE